MKQIVLTLFLVFSLGTLSQAQSISVEKWQQADSQERKSMLKDMSPEQKKLFYKDLRENMLVEELKVPAKDRESFKRMYSEYQDSQRRIKEDFSHDFDPVFIQHLLLEVGVGSIWGYAKLTSGCR